MARFLALDWDQNQLHVIAADVTKGSVRVKKAMVWQESRVPNAALAEELGNLLKDKLKEAGLAPAPVLACVGRDRFSVKEIKFPSVPDLEEPAVVRFQTVKEITDAAEDVVIDYVTNGPPVGGEQKASALVVRKEFVHAYKAVCEVAGLKLAAMSPRTLGVAACLRKVMGTTVITPFPTPREGVVAIVNAGEKLAEISILKGDTFLLTRSLNVGPNLPNEVRRNLSIHAGQQPHLPVVAVYLSGHGSGELRQRLGDMIEQPVYTFDPFAWAESIDFGEGTAQGQAGKTALNLLQETDAPRPSAGSRGSYAGAMGMLFLQSASAEFPINFVSPRQPKPPANPNYKLIRLGVVAAVVLFAGLIVLGQVLQAMESSKLDRLRAEITEYDGKLTQSKIVSKRLKDIDDWDTVVWIDEIYELAALIPDVNKLRVTSFVAEPVVPKKGEKGEKGEKGGGKVTIKGKLLEKRSARELFNQLTERFGKDSHYSVRDPIVTDDTFSFVVVIERRSPDDYKSLVKAEKPAPAKPAEEAVEEELDPQDFGKAAKEQKAALEAAKAKLAQPEGKGRGKGKGKGKRNDGE